MSSSQQDSLEDAVYELEKTLSCPSCGKVRDLQTHAACGAANKCSSCWQQHSTCPGCRQSSVDQSSLLNLARILTMNAERASGELNENVDAFEFLKALQDYNDATTKSKENDHSNNNKQQSSDKNDEQQAKESNTNDTETLVDRNCFGGKAFYGGNDSKKTGRIGRRRMERAARESRRNPSPEKQPSFDDGMFDFHSQSSMPASQVAFGSQASMAAPPEDDANDDDDDSQQANERPKAAMASERLEASQTLQSSQNEQEEDSRIEPSTSPDDATAPSENVRDESPPPSNGDGHERYEQQSARNESKHHADSQETQLESSSNHQTDSISSKNGEETTRDESKSQQQQESTGESQAPDHNTDSQETQLESTARRHADTSSSGGTTRHVYSESRKSIETDAMGQRAHDKSASSRASQEVECERSSVNDDTTKNDSEPRRTRNDAFGTGAGGEYAAEPNESLSESHVDFDSQETRLDPNTSPQTSTFMNVDEELPSKPLRRRVTILPPPKQDEQQQRFKPPAVDYGSIVTPATLSRRKRQRTESPPRQSPTTKEEDANAEGFQARLDMASIERTTEANPDNEMDSKVHDNCHYEDTQQSLDSQCLPNTLDFHHAMPPPPGVPWRQQRDSSTANGSIPHHMQGGSQSSLPTSDGPINTSTNVESSGIVPAVRRDQAVDQSEDTQQTLLPSQELPSTCDFLRTFLPPSTKESSSQAPSKEQDATLSRSAEGGDDEDQSSHKNVGRGSLSASTPPVRPDLDVDSQTSLNSQLSIESRFLPSSVDFYHTTGVPLSPSVPLRSRSESSTAERLHSETSDNSDDARTSTRSSKGHPNDPAEVDTGNPSGVHHEPCLHRDEGRDDEPDTDLEPIDHKVRNEGMAKASLDSEIDRFEEPQHSLPSPSNTQETLPSQCLPNTCDFFTSFHLPESQEKMRSSSRVGSERHGPSDEKQRTGWMASTAAPDVAQPEFRETHENSTYVARKRTPDRETRELQLSRHSQSDSDSTHLDDTQNSLASCLIPGTQELGRLFSSNQQGRPLQTTISSGVSFGGEQRVSDQRDNSPDVPDTSACQQQNPGWLNTDTQQTLMPSQCLPNVNDLHALFAPSTAVGGRKNSRRDDFLTTCEEKCDDPASQTPLSSQQEASSQVSIPSQHLPNTCDFGNMFGFQGSTASPETLESQTVQATLPSPSSRPLRITLDLALEDTDLQRVQRLCKSGVLTASDYNISSCTTHFLPYTRRESDPFSSRTSASDTENVCLPTLSYFQALTLGVPVVDSSWLEGMETNGKLPGSNGASRCVWGDSGLHQKVLDLQNGSKHYSWIKATPWWKDKIGPCQLPLSKSTNMLDGYCILVPNQQYCRPLPTASTGGSPQSSPDTLFNASTRDSAAAEEPDYFQHLTKYEMETLCQLLGATVVQTVDELARSDESLKRLALLPASMPPGHFSLFSKQRLLNATLMNNAQLKDILESQKIWALRSTWLTDSLSARHIAPLDEYAYGILMLICSGQPKRRRRRTNVTVDNDNSQFL